MFERFPETPLFGANLVTRLFRDDPRPDKVDLGLGVYRNEEGQTPVLACVKKAEERLLATQQSKAYVGLAGDPAFSDALAACVLGAGFDRSRCAMIQTPGGVAALRIGFEAIRAADTASKVWVSSPSWANHVPIIRRAGLETEAYPYYDPKRAGVNFERMMAFLETLPAGDVVLLQTSCHNPTGADLTTEQWDELAALFARRGLLAVLDVAYQGLGKGLDRDAYGARRFFDTQDELLIAATCSKDFSVYRDRVGILLAKGANSGIAERTGQKLAALVNGSYAMPPDHGAAVVLTILGDETLNALWRDELAAIRTRLGTLRAGLAEAFRQTTGGRQFDFLERHEGMFSMLPLSVEQVRRLQQISGFYLVDNGRMNIAGLPLERAGDFAQAVHAILQADALVV